VLGKWGDFQGQAQMSGAFVTSILVSALLLKFQFNPDLLKKDLAHHMSGSVVPTFSMATMVIANSVNYYIPATIQVAKFSK
jgi:exfoliative toxin A/B